MKIESIIKRKNGTKIEMDAPQRTYHFRPEEDNETAPHVADVDVQDHALALLRIKEGYRLAEGEELPNDLNNQNDDEILNGSTIHSASYAVKGDMVIKLEELIEMAFDDSGLDHKEWNELSDEDRYAYIDATLADLQGNDAGNNGDGGAGQTVVNSTATVLNNNSAPVPLAPAAGPDSSLNSAGNAGGAGPDNVAGTNTGGAGSDNSGAGKNMIGEFDMDTTQRKDLADAYEKKFGRKPSTRMSKEDLAHALKEED